MAVAEGDACAWSTLVDRFTSRLRTVARRHGLATHDTDDVVQTAWLRLIESIGDLRDPGAVGAWLEVTARRESLRVVRDAKRETPTPAESLPEPVTASNPSQRLVAAERGAAFVRALERLTHRQRQLIRALLEDAERSYAEISAELSIPVGAIGPTRARALERLRSDETLMSSW
jgi:RNA polymerase sigma factor (sigma-70 family)